MKIMGIDYGMRRIGVAVSDSAGISVRGLTTIDRHKHPDPAQKICALIAAEQPEKLIFGLPLTIDEQETAMSVRVREFAAHIGVLTPLPIDFVDESYSSRAAAELLRYRKKSVRRDKSQTDRVAACLIVNHYLELNPSLRENLNP
jgi:putative Holliday junction resolvase